MFCHVGREQVLAVHDVASVYHVPLLLQDQGIVKYLTKRLHLEDIQVDSDRRLHGAGIATRWKELTIGCVPTAFRQLSLITKAFGFTDTTDSSTQSTLSL